MRCPKCRVELERDDEGTFCRECGYVPEPIEAWRSLPWSTFRDEATDELRFLIAGLWPEGSLGFISAPPKKGKTWVGIGLALAIATGRPLFGEYAVEEPRPVLYIALEGARSGLRARIGALARGLGIDPDWDDLDRLHIAYRPRPFNLADPELAALLVDEARSVDAALVVVDVLRQAVRGVNESSAEDFATVRDALEPLLAESRSVAVLHHFGKLSETQKERTPGERMAGSGAMYGALDVGLFITRSENGARRLRLELEARDFATPDALGVVIVGSGSGEHGGFTYRDAAEFVLDASAAEERDHAAELEALFHDGEWRTEPELASKARGLAANKDAIREALKAHPERFVRIEGELAKLVGRRSDAKPWGTVEMLRLLEAEKVAPTPEPPEPPGGFSTVRPRGGLVAPLKGSTPEPPAPLVVGAPPAPEPPESANGRLEACVVCGSDFEPDDAHPLRCRACSGVAA